MLLLAMLLPIIAALCCVVSAGWLRQLGGGDDGQSWIARETGIATESDQFGWSPKPTPAPGAQLETEHVLDLLLKRETTSNWTNSETCGWMSGVSSSPWTCGDNSTCATNEDHIVACILGTLSDFYSVCLDYDAYLASSCQNDALGTGCCTGSAYGACATYLWTGEPARSMYRCASSSVIITMLDEPQFVVDASLSFQNSQTAAASSIGTNTNAFSSTTHVGSSNLQTGKAGPSDNINRLAAIIASSVIGGLFSLWLLYRFVFVPCRRKRQLQDQEHADIQDRLDAVFDPVGPVTLAARDDHAIPVSDSSNPDTRRGWDALTYPLTPSGFLDLSALASLPRAPPSPSGRAGSVRPLGEPSAFCLFVSSIDRIPFLNPESGVVERYIQPDPPRSRTFRRSPSPPPRYEEYPAPPPRYEHHLTSPLLQAGAAPREAVTSSAPQMSTSLVEQRFPSSPHHSSRREPLSSSSSLSPPSPFTDSRNDLNNNNDNPPPPEYSVLNPYPDAAPSSSERPREREDNSSRAGDEGDIELRLLGPRTRAMRQVTFPDGAGPSSTTPTADAK